VKIGLIIYGSLDTLSGGFLYDRHLVAHLVASGCQVEILSLPWRTYSAHLTDNLRLSWARRIADAHYDLLLQDELNHPSLFLLNHVLHRLSACPIVSIVHHLRSAEEHPAALMPLYHTVERHYLQTVDGFIYNSRTTQRIVHHVIGHAMPNVIAYPAADHRQPPAHDTVIAKIQKHLQWQLPLQLLFVGNLMARKGLHTVLHALAHVPSKDWHLHIIGSQEVDPAYSVAMHELVSAFGLSPHVTWYGRVSDQTLSHLFSISDLLVMPSYEGFGIVYLEAMAFGLPVLAAQAGAAPEIITPGINGYLVALGDDAALACQLDRLIHNRVLLATLAYQARLRYEEHPTWTQSMQSGYQWLHEFTARLRAPTL
jgi:glycosyltransferase involved in cell wall biosynthesis